MLLNINSQYLIQNIFSFIDHKKKLKLVKYNKTLQQKLDINLIFYKNLTCKYIIYESKGKGKEYNQNNILIFKGKYKNGERNGYGEEFNEKGIATFKGNYKNGLREGYGEEHDQFGALQFKGEYKNGKRHGKGIEYDFWMYTPEFEGEYLNGERWNGTYTIMIMILMNGLMKKDIL